MSLLSEPRFCVVKIREYPERFRVEAKCYLTTLVFDAFEAQFTIKYGIAISLVVAPWLLESLPCLSGPSITFGCPLLVTLIYASHLFSFGLADFSLLYFSFILVQVVFFVLFCFARGRAKDKFGGVDNSYFYTLCSPLFSIFYACFPGKTGFLTF